MYQRKGSAKSTATTKDSAASIRRGETQHRTSSTAQPEFIVLSGPANDHPRAPSQRGSAQSRQVAKRSRLHVFNPDEAPGEIETLLRRVDKLKARLQEHFTLSNTRTSPHRGDKRYERACKKIDRWVNIYCRAHAYRADEPQLTYREIGRRLRVSEQTISGYFNGVLPLPVAWYSQWVNRKNSLPNCYSPQLAYFFGAYAGKVKRAGETLAFHHKERELMIKLKTALKEGGIDVKLKQVDIHGTRYHFAVISNRELTHALNKLTEGNTAVLWSRLLSAEERREYLRGFCDFARGSIHSSHHRVSFATTVHNDRPGPSSLLKGMAILMKREGILPTLVRTGERSVLAVNDYNDLKIFAQQRLFTTGVRRDELNASVERDKPTRVGVRPEVYNAVVNLLSDVSRSRGGTLRERDGSFPAVKICRAVQNAFPEYADMISPWLIKRWCVAGDIPSSVMRQEALETLENKVLSKRVKQQMLRSLQERMLFADAPDDVIPALAAAVQDGILLAGRINPFPERYLNQLRKQKAFPPLTDFSHLCALVGIAHTAPFFKVYCQAREAYSGPGARTLAKTWSSGLDVRATRLLDAIIDENIGDDPPRWTKALRQRLIHETIGALWVSGADQAAQKTRTAIVRAIVREELRDQLRKRMTGTPAPRRVQQLLGKAERKLQMQYADSETFSYPQLKEEAGKLLDSIASDVVIERLLRPLSDEQRSLLAGDRELLRNSGAKSLWRTGSVQDAIAALHPILVQRGVMRAEVRQADVDRTVEEVIRATLPRLPVALEPKRPEFAKVCREVYETTASWSEARRQTRVALIDAFARGVVFTCAKRACGDPPFPGAVERARDRLTMDLSRRLARTRGQLPFAAEGQRVLNVVGRIAEEARRPKTYVDAGSEEVADEDTLSDFIPDTGGGEDEFLERYPSY